ncbi:MAG: prepilin peptidase [Methylacidiphilales bacterium]|nr:prepilin peptidase [Candidatus Methylacidiphilales bacterium]
MALTLLNYLAPFLVGACIGSFLNVCIYRIPLGRSVIHPGSHCAACGSPIPWQYNIPILGWLLLRGRAACCGTKIDSRYPLVEFITAAAFVALWNLYPPTPAWIYILFACGLIIATFIDLDHFIIPDRISLGGCLAGLLLSAVCPELHEKSTAWQGFLFGCYGLLLGGGLLYAIAVLGSAVLKKDAMGMGDVKFLAAMGAFLGWQAPLFIIMVSSLVGSVFGIALMIRRHKRWGLKIPFGPFLAIAAAVWLLGGKQWMADYIHYVTSPR